MELPKEIIILICEYTTPIPRKLHDWIPRELKMQPFVNAYSYEHYYYKIKDYSPEDIDRIGNSLPVEKWKNFSKLPTEIRIIESHLDKVDWISICYNPNAIHIIRENLHRINIDHLYYNINIYAPDYKKYSQLINAKVQQILAITL